MLEICEAEVTTHSKCTAQKIKYFSLLHTDSAPISYFISRIVIGLSVIPDFINYLGLTKMSLQSMVFISQQHIFPHL